MNTTQETQAMYTVVPEKGFAETQIMQNTQFISDTLALIRSQKAIGINLLPPGMTEELTEWTIVNGRELMLNEFYFSNYAKGVDDRTDERLATIFDASSTYTALLKGIYAKYFPDAEF